MKLHSTSSIYWDMHKNELSRDNTRNWSEENTAELAAHDFEIRIQNLMSNGAVNREMALSWIHQAEGTNGDVEYLCYLLDLPQGYFTVTA